MLSPPCAPPMASTDMPTCRTHTWSREKFRVRRGETCGQPAATRCGRQPVSYRLTWGFAVELRDLEPLTSCIGSRQPMRHLASSRVPFSAAQRTAVGGEVALQELVPAGDELQVALCVCQYPAGLDHNGAAVGESHVARQADVTIDTGGEVECVHPISGVGQADPAGRVCPAELEMVQRVIQIPADVVEEL